MTKEQKDKILKLYELQYRIKYDDGTSRTEWRIVARDEYEAFVGEK